jgi:hypothetical protein
VYPDEVMRVANEQTSLDVSRFDYCGVEIRFLTYDRRGEQETVVSGAVRHSISRSRSKAPPGSELSSGDNQVAAHTRHINHQERPPIPPSLTEIYVLVFIFMSRPGWKKYGAKAGS